jgi:hypothetical protein
VKYLSENSTYPGLGTNPRPPEYEIKVSPLPCSEVLLNIDPKVAEVNCQRCNLYFRAVVFVLYSTTVTRKIQITQF